MPETKARAAWEAAHTTRITTKINHNTDADILEKLATVPNKQGYIKQLIREDIRRGN